MTDYLRAWQVHFLEQASIALEEVRATGKSKGILLIGDSGVGKTHAFDKFSQLHPARRNGSQRVVSLVRLSIGTSATWDSNARLILAQLGRPAPNLPRAKLLKVMLDALTANETESGLFEEFHNGILKVTAALSKQNTEFLKDMWNFHDPANPLTWTSPLAGEASKGLLLCVSGTPPLEAPFLSSDEMSSRFNIVIRADRPALFPESALRDFQMLVQAMRDRFKLPKEISPNDSDLLARLYFATSAHLRLLEHLFQRTASLLKRNGQLSAREALARAHYAVIPPRPGADFNPFELSRAELSERVNRERLRWQTASK